MSITYVTVGCVLKTDQQIDVGLYEGYWKAEVGPHGRGESFYTPSNTRYIGEWAFGQRHGHGKAFEPGNRLVYNGDWAFGVRKGKGKEYDATREGTRLVYEGEFSNNERHGLGRLFDGDRTVHEGFFFEGNPYTGHLFRSEPHGEGMLYFPEGTQARYRGQWYHGYRNGQGTAYLPNGARKYEGDWVSDLPQGKGVVYHGNGEVKYSGDLFEGREHGWGSLCSEDGTLLYAGHWVNGKPSNHDSAYEVEEDREEDRQVESMRVWEQNNGEIRTIVDEFCVEMATRLNCDGPNLMMAVCDALVERYPKLRDQARFFALLQRTIDDFEDVSDETTVEKLVDNIAIVGRVVGKK